MADIMSQDVSFLGRNLLGLCRWVVINATRNVGGNNVKATLSIFYMLVCLAVRTGVPVYKCILCADGPSCTDQSVCTAAVSSVCISMYSMCWCA